MDGYGFLFRWMFAMEFDLDGDIVFDRIFMVFLLDVPPIYHLYFVVSNLLVYVHIEQNLIFNKFYH